MATQWGWDSNFIALLGNGDGTFRVGTTLLLGNDLRGLAVGDLDGDGIPDVAVANHRNGTITILRGNGDGTFAARVDLAADSPVSVVLHDVDGDGNLDVLWAGEGFAGLGVWRGDGAGGFSGPQTVAVPSVWDDAPCSLAVGNLDRDGRPDVVLGTYAVRVLRNVCLP